VHSAVDWLFNMNLTGGNVLGNQHEITGPCRLLDENGLIANPGYAVKPHWKYDRKTINAGWHRIKEWDYYSVLTPEKGYGITFTIADLGYIGLVAVCWLDFNNKTFTQLDTMSLLPRGRMGLPQSSLEGATVFEDKKIRLKYEVSSNKRVITVESPKFKNNKGETGLEGKLILHQDPKSDSMAIATSWEENRKAFYYNHKINCMPVEGAVIIGDTTYQFNPGASFGNLDWGRGNWTYKNRWYWGSASGLIDNEPFGWNIGYGFSDRSPASENMLFYKGKAHKLEEIIFHMNTEDYMEPWKFTSSDGRFEMDFEPLVDRNGVTDFKIIRSVQHQVFGHFTGTVILDNGEKLNVDNFFGFAEDVLNWW